MDTVPAYVDWPASTATYLSRLADYKVRIKLPPLVTCSSSKWRGKNDAAQIEDDSFLGFSNMRARKVTPGNPEGP
jgi:hypothetical protein